MTICTPHSPAILLGRFPTEMLIRVYQKTYAIMLIKMLFVIIQTGNYSSANNRNMKNILWYIYTMEYYTLMGRN